MMLQQLLRLCKSNEILEDGCVCQTDKIMEGSSRGQFYPSILFRRNEKNNKTLVKSDSPQKDSRISGMNLRLLLSINILRSMYFDIQQFPQHPIPLLEFKTVQTQHKLEFNFLHAESINLKTLQITSTNFLMFFYFKIIKTV